MTKAEPRTSFEWVTDLILDGDLQRLREAAPSLAEAIPELAPTVGFDQRSPHHAYDLFTHIILVTSKVPPVPALRWAALLHDVGKIPTFTRDETGRGHFYGHAPASGKMADAVLRRLEAPEALRRRAVLLIEMHMTKLKPEKDALRQTLEELGWEAIDQLLSLQEADMSSKGEETPREMAQFPKLRQLLEEIKEEASI